MRIATPDDVGEVVAMGAAFAERAGQQFVEADARDYVDHLLGRGIVLIAEDGVLGGQMTTFPWARHVRIAAESFWWSTGRKGLTLFRGFEDWAEAHDADLIAFSALDERVGEFLKKRGYTLRETCWVR